jgi:PAS domain S-box-containing protein
MRDEAGQIIRTVSSGEDITERKKAQETVRAIVETSRDWIWEIDANGVHTYSNPAVEGILGYRPDEIVGESSLNLLHSEDRKRVESALPGWVARKCGWSGLVLRWRHKDGGYRFLESNAVPILGAGGGLIGFRGVDRDITERKRAADALKASEQRLELAQEAAGMGMYDWDIVRDQAVCNERYFRLFGLEPQENMLSTDDWTAMVHPDDRERVLSEVARTLEEKTPYDTEYRILLPDKSVRWVSSEAEVFFDEEGKPRRMIGVVTDITERKRAEKALRLTQAAVDRAADAIFWVRGGGRIVYGNDEACRCLGYTREELFGLSIPDIDPNYPKGKFVEIWREIIEGKTVLIESLLKSKSGQVLPVELRFNCVKFDGEQYVVATARDITERKRAKAELENALLEVSKLKERVEAENIYLREEIRMTHLHGDILGQSGAMRSVLAHVEQVATTDSTVLILGETGTGKERLARAIHEMSTRRDRPLVIVNCAAMPSTLVESELFGREKGAYTGATTRQVGRFEVAHGGTIFLDEIGELSRETQAKLLRVLQEGELERLGSTETINVDVRVIAATNRDLEKAVKDGEFRDDLFYRLNVYPIAIPPLRERREDISLLVQTFVKEFNEKMGKRIESVSRRSMNDLQSYSWPGNVRELRNIVERAMIRATDNILRIDVPRRGSQPGAEDQTLVGMERQHIVRVLEQTSWRVRGEGGAADALGLKATTLESRMKKLGIERPNPGKARGNSS